MNFEWIPQLFMDFIGRIIPGAAILLAAVVMRKGSFSAFHETLNNVQEKSPWASLLVATLVAYLIGFFLDQFWRDTFDRFTSKKIHERELELKKKRIAEHNRVQHLFGRKPINLKVEDLPEWFVMHDHLRLTLPREASRLLKLRSEIQLCQCIILGYTGLCAYNFRFWLLTDDQKITEGFMVGSVIACWIWRFKLYEYLATGVCVAWLSLVSSGRFLQPPPAEPSSSDAKKTD